mmetsp:Transcript_48345/g.72085  ORF Transcript_48345/g.72085 Transcript_48345/m.72085 type:complete len:226 (-) Transcript_48345:760-1437(-)
MMHQHVHGMKMIKFLLWTQPVPLKARTQLVPWPLQVSRSSLPISVIERTMKTAVLVMPSRSRAARSTTRLTRIDAISLLLLLKSFILSFANVTSLLEMLRRWHRHHSHNSHHDKPMLCRLSNLLQERSKSTNLRQRDAPVIRLPLTVILRTDQTLPQEVLTVLMKLPLECLPAPSVEVCYSVLLRTVATMMLRLLLLLFPSVLPPKRRRRVTPRSRREQPRSARV